MRLLADENVPGAVVLRLRTHGHDVRWAGESDRGAPDLDLLALATEEVRTLLSGDKDFGALLHRDGVPAPHGVVLFRIHRDVTTEARDSFIFNSVTIWNSWPPGLWTVHIRHRPT